MKLVWKLTLATMLGICLVLAGHGYLRVRREITLIQSDMTRDHYKLGQAFAAAVDKLWQAQGKELAITLIEEANAARPEVLIRWVELDVPPTHPFRPHLAPERLEGVRQGHELVQAYTAPGRQPRLYTYIPVPPHSASVGALEISESLDMAAEYIRTSVVRVAVTTLILLAMCTLLATLIGIWFVGRPIRGLIEHARRVGAGDFAPRLEVRQHDEIGDLAVEMNAMTARLEEADGRLRAETSARIAALEQLRHADRLATVGKLASGIAHELGTPLNIVSGRARMVAAGEVTGTETLENARIIAEQADRMTAIIRQLLDFARRRSPKKERQDLVALARQTTALLVPLATKRGVTVHVDAPGGATMAEVDGGQFQQALTNLIVNGIQAMHDGGSLSVGISRAHGCHSPENGGAAQSCVQLCVADEGEGISPDVLDHVFEPFFTTKGVGHGTGLGLSVAYGIVREHGGWIEVRTEPGKGSRFSIHLPVEDAPCTATC